MKNSQKKAREEQGDYGGIIRANSTPYRVDGEIGRFEFTTYRLHHSDSGFFNATTNLFEPICSREYYRTVGFNEIALSLASNMSYRKAVAFLNRIRWETDNGTPMRTLAHVVEMEGQQVQKTMNDMAENVLAQNQFDKGAMPQKEAEMPIRLAPEEASLSSERIAEAIEHYNQGKTEEFHIDAGATNQLYENPEVTVNVSIDDVGVKKQKETGRSPAKQRKEKKSTSRIPSHMQRKKSALRSQWLRHTACIESANCILAL